MSYSEQIEELEQRLYDLREAQTKEECEASNHELHLVEAFTFAHLGGRIIHRWACDCGERDGKTVFKDTGEKVPPEAYKVPPDEAGFHRILGGLWTEVNKIPLIFELIPKVSYHGSLGKAINDG